MPQYGFGAGTMIATRTDVANSTPQQFGVLQNVEVDFEFSMKELIGQSQFPVAIARSTGKITGKAASARIAAKQYNDLFFGQTLTGSSGVVLISNETGTIPGTPYQITVAQAATFAADQGVFFAATGLPLTKVASSPATGQYSVNASGVYTFAAADTALGVLISYTYTVSSGASKIALSNQLMGSQPIFKVVLQETFNSKLINLQLNACVANKLSFPFKNQDFVINGVEFQAYADDSGNIGTITATE